MSTMALQASAATRPPLPPPKPTSSKTQLKQSVPSLAPASSAAISLVALFSTPRNYCQARAFSISKEDILSSLTQVEDTVDQVEEVGSKVLNFSQSVIKFLIDALRPTVEVVLPVLQKAGEEVVKIASPVVSDASKQAKEALQSAGVDPSPVLSAAKTIADAAKQTTKVIEGAKPIASATVESISSTDPSVLVVSAGALFLAYLIFPTAWSAVSFNIRGYKGNLSPAQTLDLISTKNHFLIDIRSEKDKNKAGVPRLPSNAKNKLISIPFEELPNKIKALVRNAKKVEAEIVALKISYLKRVNRGSKIIIMDSYSDTAKTVARALTSLGFKSCWIMADGFSGNRGWLQSRLGADSYNVTLAEVLSPLGVIPAAVGRFGTTGSSSLQATRKLLPARIFDD